MSGPAAGYNYDDLFFVRSYPRADWTADDVAADETMTAYWAAAIIYGAFAVGMMLS